MLGFCLCASGSNSHKYVYHTLFQTFLCTIIITITFHLDLWQSWQCCQKLQSFSADRPWKKSNLPVWRTALSGDRLKVSLYRLVGLETQKPISLHPKSNDGSVVLGWKTISWVDPILWALDIKDWMNIWLVLKQALEHFLLVIVIWITASSESMWCFGVGCPQTWLLCNMKVFTMWR